MNTEAMKDNDPFINFCDLAFRDQKKGFVATTCEKTNHYLLVTCF